MKEPSPPPSKPAPVMLGRESDEPSRYKNGSKNIIFLGFWGF